MPEGTIFFPDEPIIRVTAPITQAQLVETRIINILQFQTMIASKAARMQLAAPGKQMVDFGLRRAHGAEAGLFAARASYLAGFAGSSTVQACPVYDIPIFGTMAHSFIQAHDSEEEAFLHFALAQPENVVLLIDTYDTEAAAHKVVRLAPALREQGSAIRAVRLDSGDLVEHARKVRKILDDGGLPEVKIFTSGNLDEYVLAHFIETAAPIDGFGIGTKMVTSADKPYLDCAYKLCEYAGLARRKKSEGKSTWPGRKQVFRSTDANSLFAHDILTLEGDSQQGSPLIKQVMSHGTLIPQPKLTESRD
jgi:nicotinate phosphoribosyltransferase